ncbi:hypothetical protein AB1Y20_014914 [Prymnesium parvum]|uniref:Uncharacterized protein n=1 Tax=Prymnesium parvum TaxID=97485 RepID=A0AB34JZU8_PRYPA|mmetsp:Transcript_14622/g.34833  ORF Transcript_14622/g.34833 Transcript_14622/m.34833 type:complete len:87 (+) Transcript_14622:3-263(+)
MAGDSRQLCKGFEVLEKLQGAASGARNRMKTGLPPLEGDDDLVDYYYIAMHPNCATGKQLRKEKKREWPEIKARLAERFGDWVLNE